MKKKKTAGQKKCLPLVRDNGIFWSDVSVFLRPVTLVRVAVLPRLVVIIPLTQIIATFSGQKNSLILEKEMSAESDENGMVTRGVYDINNFAVNSSQNTDVAEITLWVLF